MRGSGLGGQKSVRHIIDPRQEGCPQGRKGEQGYLLVSTGVLILIVIALLGSYSFIIKRDSSYKANFAAGERFADIVAASHFYAQQQVYDTDPNGTVQALPLLADLGLPDQQTIDPINGTTFTMDVRGADLAPVNTTTPDPIKAASAYVHLKIRTSGLRTRLPSDMIAFLAGAASHGMSRAGVIGANAGSLCDTDPTGAVTRWGPDVSACLTAANVASLGFTDVQQGDIIVPAWETALARASTQVIFRYKQPERPDMNSMNTDLQFEPSTVTGAIDCADPLIHCLQDANEVRTVDITSTGNTAVGTPAAPGTFLVRQGSNTSMQQVTVNDAPVRIYDQNGSPDVMTVNGTVDLSGTTTSVGGTIKPNAGGHIDVAVVDPVTTDHLGAKTAIGETPFDIAIALSPMGGSPPAPSAAISKLAGSVITDVNMTKAGGKFSTLGRIGNPGAVTTFTNYQGGVMDVYAAEMITANSAAIRNTTDDLPWAVGAIEQNGGNPVNPAQRLTVRDITVNDECFGRACPNSANETPGGVAW